MTIVKSGNMVESSASGSVDTLTTNYTVPSGYQSKIVGVLVVNNRNQVATWGVTVNTDGNDYPIAEKYQAVTGDVYTNAPNVVLPAGAILKTGADKQSAAYTSLIGTLGVTYVITIEESKVT